MKNIILVRLLLISFSSMSFAQSGVLHQDWYLISYELDLGDYIVVSNINPSISPRLTIYDDLEFSGFGACNGYSGDFSYDDENDT